MRRQSGFTLFEVIIAVALVAIMAVAIAPPLIKNLNEGKVARAQSDAQVIGNAIQTFYKDVGDWPLQYDADTAYDTARLVGNADLGGGNTGLPRGANANADAWRTRGATAVLDNLLIRNCDAAGTSPLYTVSANPHVKPGWNGPYLERIPLDPWGNPYVVNVYYGRPDLATAHNHNVMVLSAGANELFDTPFADAVSNEAVAGDDIAYVIRGSDQH
jgi:prepilin-type N-terminal cleavage/methylation domain-containing protein